MLTHFSAADFTSLSAMDRARKCRELAAESDRLAATAAADLSDAYLELAAQWRALAGELDRSESAAA